MNKNFLQDVVPPNSQKRSIRDIPLPTGRNKVVREPDVIVNRESEEREEVLICCWYDVIYGSIRGLKEFSPESMKWGQAHMSGNYAILNVMMKADPDFIKIKETDNGNNMLIEFDHTKIRTVGRPAVGEFLKVLRTFLIIY